MLSDCTADWGEGPVFSGLNISFHSGETSSVVGLSGCGKTTLLMTAAALLAPACGSVKLDGEPLRRGDRRIGLILQNYGLFPWLTVWQNITLGLRIRGGLRQFGCRRSFE